MTKIALVVTIEYKPEAKASMLKALLEHKGRCLSSEPGTLQFEVLTPSESTNEVVLFELYEDAEALKRHDSGVSLSIFKEQAGPFINKASVRLCHLLSAAEL